MCKMATEQEECNRLQKEAEDALKKQKLQELMVCGLGSRVDRV